MKKIFIVILCILPFAAAHGQKISDKEAQAFLEKAWGYLKAADSVSFVNLWPAEDSAWQKLNAPGINYMDSYHRLKKFLAPAISASLDIDHIVTGQENARGTGITAMLRPRENAFIGFTFYVASVNGKWIPRGKPNFLAKSR